MEKHKEEMVELVFLTGTELPILFHTWLWSRSPYITASCPVWIIIPSGSLGHNNGNAHNNYGVAYVCFLIGRGVQIMVVATVYGQST